MSWFLRNALAGILIIWLAASVLGFVIGLGFAGSLQSMFSNPVDKTGTWLFIFGPWLIVLVLLAFRKRNANG